MTRRKSLKYVKREERKRNDREKTREYPSTVNLRSIYMGVKRERHSKKSMNRREKHTHTHTRRDSMKRKLLEEEDEQKKNIH